MNGRRLGGFTLVELLVGLAVGLVIVAAAATFAAAHVRDLRALWMQSRLMHDLRVAADVVAHDLRRAGHWRDAAALAWSAERGASAPANPHALVSPVAAPSDAARFSYSHDGDAETDEPFGFRLREGVIEMRLGDGPWQALTDAGSVVVTSFRITPQVQEIALQGLCGRACDEAAGCAPIKSVRSLDIAIHGHAADDTRLVRSVQSVVRLRNDKVSGACAP